MDTIFQSYSFDGGFQSKRFFAEYYWGMSAARDDLDPTKNELINYIKRWEASGAEFEHILICREWEVQGAHWPEAKPGPFKGDTRILFEKDVDDIRELFRQAHQAGLIKHGWHCLGEPSVQQSLAAGDCQIETRKRGHWCKMDFGSRQRIHPLLRSVPIQTSRRSE